MSAPALSYNNLFGQITSYPLYVAYSVDKAFDPSVAGQGAYSGVVLVGGLPASRHVLIFDATTSTLIRSVVSSAVDGSWTVSNLRVGMQILIVVKAQGNLERDAASIRTVQS